MELEPELADAVPGAAPGEAAKQGSGLGYDFDDEEGRRRTAAGATAGMGKDLKGAAGKGVGCLERASEGFVNV